MYPISRFKGSPCLGRGLCWSVTTANEAQKKKKIVFFVVVVAVGGNSPWTSREVVEGGGRVEPSAVCLSACLSAWPV